MEAVEIKNNGSVRLDSLPIYTLFKFPNTNDIQVKLSADNTCMFLQHMNGIEQCGSRFHEHSKDSKVIPVELVKVEYMRK